MEIVCFWLLRGLLGWYGFLMVARGVENGCCVGVATAGVSASNPFGVLLLGSFSLLFGTSILVVECQFVCLFVVCWTIARMAMVLLLLLLLFERVWSIANNDGIHDFSQ